MPVDGPVVPIFYASVVSAAMECEVPEKNLSPENIGFWLNLSICLKLISLAFTYADSRCRVRE